MLCFPFSLVGRCARGATSELQRPAGSLLRGLAAMALALVATAVPTPRLLAQTPPPLQRIVKLGPDSVGSGDVFDYTIEVRATSRARQDVLVIDSLPASGTVLAISGGGVLSGGVIRWPAIPSLTVGGPPAVFTVTYRAPAAPATLVNTAILVSARPNLDEPQRSTLVTRVLDPPPPTPYADVRVTKQGPATVVSEGVFRYDLAVENLGPAPALGVVVEDVLPSSGRFLSASGGGVATAGVVRWPPIASLAVGARVTYTVDFQAPTGPTTLINTAEVRSATPDSVPGNNRTSVSTAVQPVTTLVDVSVRKTGPASVSPNEVFSYALEVRNVGNAPALQVTVTDRLPTSGTFISASAGGTEAGGIVRWPVIAALGPGAVRTFTVTFQAPASGSLINTAVVSTPGDSIPGNDTSTVTTGVVTPPGSEADLEVEKTGPATVRQGLTATYTIVVRNHGPATALDVVVTDTLPDPRFAPFVSADPAELPHGPDPPFITWPTLPSLAAGDSAVFRVVLSMPTTATVTDIATVGSSTPDPDSTNNVDSVSTRTELGEPGGDITLLKQVDRPEADIGDIVQYRLDFRAEDVVSAQLTDHLPPGFRYVPGSARVLGGTPRDPSEGPAGLLDFGRFPSDTATALTNIQVAITYRVRIGPEAPTGDGINRAHAVTSDGREDDAEARVRLRGVFSGEGMIVGTVFLSCDCDDAQDPGELGIPGVRVFLQDGTAAVTDLAGKYSFYGLRPRTWVVRIDPTTLPPGARMAPLTNRHGNDGQSAFVDLKRGELHRADFAEGGRQVQVREEVTRRRTHPEVTAAIPTAGDRGPTVPVEEFRPLLPEWTFDDRNTNLPPAAGLPEAPDGGGLRGRGDPLGGSRPSADIEIDVGSGGFRADGASHVPVVVRHRGTSAVPVTLETSAGTWLADDVDLVQPGLQVLVAPGGSTFELQAPDQPTKARLRAILDGQRSASRTLTFAPRLSPLVALGLLEARIDLRSLVDGELRPGSTRDHFEDRLTGIDWSSADGDVFGGARAAAFVTGAVGASTDLTLRIDSEEDPDARLFRDIQPDAFYPVYGDASLRQYGAQSTGRVFAELRRGASSLLYGDFVTAAPATYGAPAARALGAYARSLNGALQHFENERVSLDAFASRDHTAQVVDEIAGRGVSGPYALSRADGRINSERVELITRDRNQPGVVLRTEVLERFADYTFEPLSGRLLFKRPVPSVDAELNPVVIRVAYEVESGGDDFWVFGGFGQVRPGDRLELGGGWIRDDAPRARYDLASANATLDLGRSTYLIGEFARSERALPDSAVSSAVGSAGRVELQHASDRLATRLFYLETERGFDNPSTAFRPGRREWGGRSTVRLDQRTQLFGEWLHTEDLHSGGERRGGRVALDRALGEWMRGRLGFRWSHESGGAAVPGASSSPDAVNAVGAQLTARLPFLPGGSLFGEFEQDVSDADQRRAVLGGDYRILERTRVYGRHEFISSLSGPYGLAGDQERNTTVFGIATDYGRGPTLFSEYRARDAFSGRDAQAAIGLRNRWTVKPGVNIDGGLERVSPLGSGDSTSTAVTAGVALTQDSLWKATARAEYYASDGNDQLLGSLGYARKVSRDLTLLGSTLFSSQLDGDRAFERTRLGIAYRETEQNRWNGLARYEHRYERAPDLSGSENERAAHIFAAHVNWQPDPDLILRAQWASKFASDETAGVRETDRAHLLGARGTLDVTDRLDLGLIGRALFANAHETVQFGVGAEVGLLLADNLRLAGGYNAFGFRDRELSQEEYTDRGFYLQLGFKFDETLFGHGEPDRGRVETGPCACDMLTVAAPDLVVEVERDASSTDEVAVMLVRTSNRGNAPADVVKIMATIDSLEVLDASHGEVARLRQIEWHLDRMLPAEVHLDTLRVRLPCEAVGHDTVTASASSWTSESDTTNNHDSGSARLRARRGGCGTPPDTTRPSADIEARVQGTPAATPTGRPVVFRITTTNLATVPAATVTLQATVVRGPRPSAASGASPLDGVYDWDVVADTLAPGRSQVRELRFDIPRCRGFGGTLLLVTGRTATATNETSTANNSSADTVFIEQEDCPIPPRGPDLRVRIQPIGPAPLPDSVQWFEVTTWNAGSAAAENVTLSAQVPGSGNRSGTLPATVRPRFVSGQLDPDGRLVRGARELGSHVEWDAHPTLAPGSAITDWVALTVPCAPDARGTLEFDLPVRVATSTPERDTLNNRAATRRGLAITCTPVQPSADTTDVAVSIAVLGPRVVAPGALVPLLLTSANVDTVTALGVLRSAGRPLGARFVRGSSERPQAASIQSDTVIWAPSWGSMVGGAVHADTLFLTAPPQSFVVRTWIATDSPDRDPTNDTASVAIEVSDGLIIDPPDSTDLTIEIVPPVHPTCPALFQLVTRNRGTRPALNVSRTLRWSPQTAPSSSRRSASKSGSRDFPTLVRLEAGERWVDTVPMVFGRCAAGVLLQAEVASTPADDNPSNNRDEIVVLTQDTVQVVPCDTCGFCLWPLGQLPWWLWLLALLALLAWLIYRHRRYGRFWAPCFRLFTIFRRREIRATVSELRQQENRAYESTRRIHDRVGGQPCADWDVTIELLHAYRDSRSWPQIYELMRAAPPALARKPIVRRLFAFALHRDGRTAEAERELLALKGTQGPRPTTLGMLGRIYKDAWETARKAGSAEAQQLLERAIQTYREGHECEPSNPYPGVNALTLAEFLPSEPSWRQAVLEQVKKAAKEWATEFDYWVYATRAEVAVLDGDQHAAELAMRRALKTRHVIWQVETTVRNLGLITQAREQRGETIPGWLTALITVLGDMVRDADG